MTLTITFVPDIDRKKTEITWHLKKVEGYATALFERFCPFKVGDKVKLTRTPEITETKAWGWMGSKHFLVKGAVATVREIDYRSESNCFEYWLEFDNDSFINSITKEVVPIVARKLFVFLEKDVEVAWHDKARID